MLGSTLISMFVDQSDKTPNEHRSTSISSKEETFFPFANLYPGRHNDLISLPRDVDNKLYPDIALFLHDLKEQQILYAIRYLQVAALKQFLVKNFFSTRLTNPFETLLYVMYCPRQNIDAFKEIIQVLIDRYDDWYRLIKALKPSNLLLFQSYDNFVIEVLYSFLPCDEDNVCSLCLYTEPIEQLINPCKCAAPIHSKCLEEVKKHTLKKYCTVCLDSFQR
jgi:hypothetical protein